MNIDNVIQDAIDLWKGMVEEEFDTDEEVASTGYNEESMPVEKPTEEGPQPDDPAEDAVKAEDAAELTEEASVEPEAELPADANVETGDDEPEQQDESAELPDETPTEADTPEEADDSLPDGQETDTNGQDFDTLPEEPELAESTEDAPVQEDATEDVAEETDTNGQITDTLPEQDDDLPSEETVAEEDEPEQPPTEEQALPEEEPPLADEEQSDLSDRQLQDEPTEEFADDLPGQPTFKADDSDQPLNDLHQQNYPESPLYQDSPLASEDEVDLPNTGSGRVAYSTVEGGYGDEAAGPQLGDNFIADLQSALSPQMAELRHVIAANLQDSLDREAIISDTMSLEQW